MHEPCRGNKDPGLQFCISCLLICLSIGHAASGDPPTSPSSSPSNVLSEAAPAPAPAQEIRSPAEGPLAFIGPRPNLQGPAILCLLDLYGPSLYSFDETSQERLLYVINMTITSVNSDELQLISVEELLPLNGPSAVSVFGKYLAPPPEPSTALGRKLLQSLAQAGDQGDEGYLQGFAHIQTSVKVATTAQQADLVKSEIVKAVNGPMLPLLNQQGLDVDFLRLTSMTMEAEMGTHHRLQPYAIGLIVAAASLLAAVSVGFALVFWRRQREGRLNGKSSGSVKDVNADSTHASHISFPYSGGNVVNLPGLSPPRSVVSSRSSLYSKSSLQKIGNGTEIKTGMWNVPLSELQFSRVIGEGSFGKVYLGKWQETTVAIKILTSPQGPLPDSSWDLQDVTQLKDCSWSATKQGQTTAQRLLVEELTRESTLMAALRHPNIVLFLGISLEPPCMLTEFCARGSLLDVLHRARNIEAVALELDWRRRLRLALDAAKGMHYLHTRQPPVLHRDLKSANLLVDKHWQAKVADFNLSRVVQPSAAVSSLAATNPRWLPPEVLVGNGYDSSADVYAFGIILWEMLTWEVPWKDETPWQVVIFVVDHDLRPSIDDTGSFPGGLPVAYDDYLDLMRRCWATAPTERPNYETIIGAMRSLIDAEDVAMRISR